MVEDSPLSQAPHLAVPGHANPLLRLYEVSGAAEARRREANVVYSFAIPDDVVLGAIKAWSPHGVVEIGAGLGYWAWQLRSRGVDVAAYDVAPPPSEDNEWFAGQQPWSEVKRGDESAASAHPDRTLLIVWPTGRTTWPGDAIEAFHRTGGATVVFVGEGPGGRTGDDRFHALLGEIERCLHCHLGVRSSACVCEVPRLFEPFERVAMLNWPRFQTRLTVYTRRTADLT
jgi:hypothetical protein